MTIERSQTMSTEWEDIDTLVGPKKVDTKEATVEAHDPLKLQQLLERRKPSKPVMFHQFSFTKVVPKCNVATCYESDKDCGCNCG